LLDGLRDALNGNLRVNLSQGADDGPCFGGYLGFADWWGRRVIDQCNEATTGIAGDVVSERAAMQRWCDTCNGCSFRETLARLEFKNLVDDGFLVASRRNSGLPLIR